VLPVPSVIILFGILIIYLIGGCFMGGLAFMILTLPVFFPVAVSLQFDPLWFGVLMVIMVEVGSTTPPVGIAAYIISGISKDISVEVVFKGLLPFLVAFAICLIILIAFPEIALFLPSLMG
jgi:C4-dicarboxylate transporter DctM subunit